jgi:GNAT superfamily N-acetyltransferase
MNWTLRAATARDAEQVALVLREGFDSYRSFAPAGWEPPAPPDELEQLRERLADPDVWCLVAEAEDGTPAGHVALMPASAHAHPPAAEPGLAHLWQLFVRPRWWGSGLAAQLHGAVVGEAAARGYCAMRLFTPAPHPRARRFYEREGWALAREPFEAPEFGMPLAEYRRAISISV